MSDPKKEFESQYAETLERSRSLVADFWQGQAAYWQTVADIMGRRAATGAGWWQALPQQWQALAQPLTQGGGWPTFVEQAMRWQQQNWLAAWRLNVDTQHQRNHLLEEWQKLAQRNGLMPQAKEDDKPAAPSSYYAANPHVTPQAARPAPQPKPQPTPQPQKAAPSAAYVPQPRGTFIPGPENKIVNKIVAPVEAPAPVPVSEPNGHEHTPLAEPARNAAQAATLAGASSARRSVVASHRSRSSRRSH